jgi:hypothetical protein
VTDIRHADTDLVIRHPRPTALRSDSPLSSGVCG